MSSKVPAEVRRYHQVQGRKSTGNKETGEVKRRAGARGAAVLHARTRALREAYVELVDIARELGALLDEIETPAADARRLDELLTKLYAAIKKEVL